MNSSFERYGSWAAMLTGVLSIVYAVLFLIVSKGPDDTGRLLSWVVLGLGGMLSSAAYVVLYQRLRANNESMALWGLLLGIGQSFFTFTNAVTQALLIYNVQNGSLPRAAFDAARAVPQEGDPGGVWAFVVFAAASVVFGQLILKSNTMPKTLGYVAWLNAVLLVLLFVGNVTGTPILVYAAGGLTAVIVTPLYWIWTGRALASQKFKVVSQRAMA